MAEDEDSTDPERIKKVFCSQSVVLMLRYVENDLHLSHIYHIFVWTT